MMNKIKNIIRTDQQMVFIFLSKLLRRAELRDKNNAIEHNRVTTRKIMFRLSLRKSLHVTKLRNIFGAILGLLKDPTVPRYWAKLTSIGCKE